MRIAHVGIDDTDSNYLGMCTTYIGALVDERLKGLGYAGIGEPRLIRLNPAYPMKTRGNGAVHLRYYIHDRRDASRLFEEVENIVARYATLKDPKTDPGVVLLVRDDQYPPQELEGFYLSALRGTVDLSAALRILMNLGGMAAWFKGGRGVIGAMAAIGAPEGSSTVYELLAYRSAGLGKGPRNVDEESVRLADLETWPMTYDNYDWYYMEPLVAPRGPDPVLLGIRGPDRGAVLRGYDLIKVDCRVERLLIYRTNHGSGSHVLDLESISELKPYTTVRLEGRVSKRPIMGSGSHVFFELEDSRGFRIRVAAYEPTKHFRLIAMGLEPGDRVRITGSFRPHDPDPPTVNLERLEVLELAQLTGVSAPRCPKCGHRMESEGSGKGYRCPKCGHRDRSLRPMEVRIPRKITLGEFVPPPRAHRHLTKPPEASIWEGRPSCSVEE
ncbi:tRNA(Ile)(2)-agmatinylcytidine synthase [Conexivisphaera calida]|uniref:tRNA(Ile2) 2-agmatinylcytidine synthetase TiaS n=1 Tax=Conexivisphaera calida TaxID=1874277 RepID=A0A4P2VJ80_9ARCH|nr:tRNA(Ile)(2)-agmatinylcytidine synthase [Conexivisphaera calida]BBE41435.1 OB-fold nucleic acid binding domain protein [Conexivisphaera calida]